MEGRVQRAAGLNECISVKNQWAFANKRKAWMDALKHSDWRDQNWAKVLWSEDSKYKLFGSNGRR